MDPFKFELNAKVIVPLGEKGIITDRVHMMWFDRYYIKITKTSGFNEIGAIVDFFERDLTLDLSDESTNTASDVEKPKTWNTLKKGDPIYIIRYDHLKFPTFEETFLEESVPYLNNLTIFYHEDELINDEQYEENSYHFCVDFEDINKDKYGEGDNYTYFFANLDAVFAEMEDFKRNYIDKLINNHKLIRKRLNEIFNENLSKKLRKL